MKKYIQFIVVSIALITAISGLTQIITPGFVLEMVGAEVNPSTKQLFATVGMFMLLFGGMMLHAVYSPKPSKIIVLWSALQKIGAAIAVAIGIWNGTFAILAGLVVGFDFVSGLIYYVYLKMQPPH